MLNTAICKWDYRSDSSGPDVWHNIVSSGCDIAPDGKLLISVTGTDCIYKCANTLRYKCASNKKWITKWVAKGKKPKNVGGKDQTN